jgi:glucokinase
LQVEDDQRAANAEVIVSAGIAGIDAGGTKAHMLYVHQRDGEVADLHVRCADHDSMGELFLECFRLSGLTPQVLVAGVAGRPNRNGEVRLTNRPEWPAFRPAEFARKTGVLPRIINDMVAAAAAVPGLSQGDYELLTADVKASPNRSNLVVSVGSGVGSTLMSADGHFWVAESGHATWQAVSAIEQDYLRFLQSIYPRLPVSVEQAISGHFGFNHLFDFMRERIEPGPYIQEHVQRYRRDHRDPGPVITAAAVDGDACCQEIIRLFGSILGQYTRNLVLTGMCESDGGSIWLTSGVLQAPGVCEMLMKDGTFYDSFVGRNMQHADLMELIPIYLVTDSYVTVRGAFAMAQRIAHDLGDEGSTAAPGESDDGHMWHH